MARKTKVNTALVVLIFALVALSAAAQDAGGMGTLAGIVLSAQGRPVAGASVVLQTANGGSPEATTTNSVGRFFFPDLTHGYYDVRATHQGWVSVWKHNVEVATGKQTEIRLQLSTEKKP